MKKLCFATLLLFAFLPEGRGQQFTNGSLNGTIGISVAPTSWAQVPYTDPVSIATSASGATSDVTGTTGPMMGVINGNPYHGSTCISGNCLTIGASTWHEGIQQTVTGFTVGTSYSINLFQCVIKQSNALDQSGGWRVYRDGTLLGTTAASNDPQPYGSNAHTWDRRSINFTATATSHLIKFLPMDNDANWNDPDGVRMGLDSLTIGSPVILPTAFQLDLSLVDDKQVSLTWNDEGYSGVTHYFIEHSPDGFHFEAAGRVEVANGSEYSFTDPHPFIDSHYRIARMMADGSILYSEVEHIQTQAPVEIALADRQLEIMGGYGGEYQLEIMDLQGNSVFSGTVPGTADLSQLASGIYFIRVISRGRENSVLEKKVVLG